MSRGRSSRDRNFSPLQDKTLVNVLRQLFATEFGYENKMAFAKASGFAELLTRPLIS